MAASPLMPAAFIGHGSPMNALERNRFTEAWRLFGASVPRPRAILVVSAHWYVNATAITAMPRPRTIHDFYGFPRELFEVQYPAPGLPELAEEVADVAKPDHVGPDIDGWGLDHGTWSVLVHAFPDADIPVVQLSINAQKPAGFHLDLGARLAALRERGVLLLGSGNVVHNLRAMDWKQPGAAFDWNQRFDADTTQLLAERPGDATSLVEHPDYALSAPTAEHFLPLLYLAGAAAAAGSGADVLVAGPAYGSLSMTSYTVGADCPRGGAVTTGAAPMPPGVPADSSNL